MIRTANLRRQHDAAVDLVRQVRSISEAEPTADRAYRMAVLLAKLTGMLRIHFVQEDKTLYPYMIASANEGAVATAHRFQAEMGGLGAKFDAYAKRWSSSPAILRDYQQFRRESRDIFDALAHRIHRENEELYPLAESIDPYQVPRTA